MKHRILMSVAVALVLVVASIISYLWRVFRISQVNKTDEQELLEGESHANPRDSGKNKKP